MDPKDDRPIPQRMPVVGLTEPGEYWWCACGRSRNQPYCDGSHKSSNHLPMRVRIDAQRKVAWCACKRTSTPPYCDGSHAKLPAGGPTTNPGFRPPIKLD